MFNECLRCQTFSLERILRVNYLLNMSNFLLMITPLDDNVGLRCSLWILVIVLWILWNNWTVIIDNQLRRSTWVQGKFQCCHDDWWIDWATIKRRVWSRIISERDEQAIRNLCSVANKAEMMDDAEALHCWSFCEAFRLTLNQVS